MTDLKSISFRLVGVCPLLQHNAQTADPLNEFAQRMKEISSKRVKTEDDHRRLADIEWEAGLYMDADGNVCMPSENIHKCLQEGAKKSKLGKQFDAGVYMPPDRFEFPLLIDGKTRKAMPLRKDRQFTLRKLVIVNRARIPRERPRFPIWSIEVELLFAPDVINEKSVIRAAEDAGRLVGLGDYRPRYGRFNVELN